MPAIPVEVNTKDGYRQTAYRVVRHWHSVGPTHWQALAYVMAGPRSQDTHVPFPYHYALQSPIQQKARKHKTHWMWHIWEKVILPTHEEGAMPLADWTAATGVYREVLFGHTEEWFAPSFYATMSWDDEDAVSTLPEGRSAHALLNVDWVWCRSPDSDPNPHVAIVLVPHVEPRLWSAVHRGNWQPLSRHHSRRPLVQPGVNGLLLARLYPHDNRKYWPKITKRQVPFPDSTRARWEIDEQLSADWVTERYFHTTEYLRLKKYAKERNDFFIKYDEADAVRWAEEDRIARAPADQAEYEERQRATEETTRLRAQWQAEWKAKAAAESARIMTEFRKEYGDPFKKKEEAPEIDRPAPPKETKGDSAESPTPKQDDSPTHQDK